jgi:hypothetical protein
MNEDFFDKLNNIIMEDDELSAKITALAEMNTDIKPDKPFKNYSTLCILLLIIAIVYYIRYALVNALGGAFEGNFIMSKLFDLLWFKNWILGGLCAFIFDFLDCDH